MLSHPEISADNSTNVRFPECCPEKRRQSDTGAQALSPYPRHLEATLRLPDGRPVFTLPMVLGLLLFYAWCLQCAATLAIIRRETNSWRWPIFAWTYMTVIGYSGALLIYQVGSTL